MLSAWAEPAPACSPAKAHSSSASSGRFVRNSASMATTAATALAALPPRPLERGSPFRMLKATPSGRPMRCRSARAAIPAVLRLTSRGSRPPSLLMASMRTPLPAGVTDTSSPGAPSANPRTSNPQATFETVAGANAVTDCIICRWSRFLLPRFLQPRSLPVRFRATVSIPDGRDQVFVKCALEIESGLKPPVPPRCPVVDVLRPGVNNALPFAIDLVVDPGLGKGRQHDLTDAGRRPTERRQVVRRSSQPLSFGRAQLEQGIDS